MEKKKKKKKIFHIEKRKEKKRKEKKRKELKSCPLLLNGFTDTLNNIGVFNFMS